KSALNTDSKKGYSKPSRTTFIKGGRICVELERKNPIFEDALKEKLKEEYLKDKFKLKKVNI
ncbi:MAG: hypothetical protein AABX39_03685, partial [Nanoarchaeota archaeon]